MKAIGLAVRFVAFLFNLVLALVMFLLALVVLSSGHHNLSLAAVPAQGRNLTLTLLLASIYAFVAMVLALRRGRGVRLPMLLWNAAVTVLLLWAPARTGFSFQGKDHLNAVLCLTIASVVALVGSWRQWREGRRG